MTRTRHDQDAAILATVSEMKDFIRSAVKDDSLPDWSVAEELGRLLVRIEPKEILGHALLARAYRHLGDRRAAQELSECRKRLRQSRTGAAVRELFRPFVEQEERHG